MLIFIEDVCIYLYKGKILLFSIYPKAAVFNGPNVSFD